MKNIQSIASTLLQSSGYHAAAENSCQSCLKC